MRNRCSDTEKKTYFHSERFYSIGSQWYFTCREGQEFGPFDSHEDAEAELIFFLRHVEMGEFDTGTNYGKEQLRAFAKGC